MKPHFSFFFVLLLAAAPAFAGAPFDARKCEVSLSEPLDFVSLRGRFDAANGGEIYLPELRADAEWLLESVSTLEKEGNEYVGEHFSDSQELTRRNSLRAGALRKKINALLLSPKGIAYREWFEVFEYYEFFFSELKQPHTASENWRSLKKQAAPILRSSAQPGEWVGLPIARAVSVKEMNAWMAEGFMPIGLVNKATRADGNLLPGHVFIAHDIGHLLGMLTMRRSTGTKLSPKAYFLAFKAALGADASVSPLLAETIEALWFYVYHEKMPESYGPASLQRVLARLQNIQRFNERLVKDDIAEDFQHGDGRREISNAVRWLRNFAARVESEQGYLEKSLENLEALKNRLTPELESKVVLIKERNREAASELLKRFERGDLRFSQGKQPERMSPKELRFMQEYCRNISHDEKYTVIGNAADLLAGRLNEEALGAIRVWQDRTGRVWALDHRRLAAYRLAGVKEIAVEWVAEAEAAANLFKLTTSNEGRSVVLKTSIGDLVIE